MTSGPADSVLPIVSEDILLSNFEGMEDVLIETIGDFERLAPGWLNDVRQAIAAKDSLRVDRAAHALKGAASNFQANRVMRIAHDIEFGARAGDLSETQNLFLKLETELNVLLAHLSQLQQRLEKAITDR